MVIIPPFTKKKKRIGRVNARLYALRFSVAKLKLKTNSSICALALETTIENSAHSVVVKKCIFWGYEAS